VQVARQRLQVEEKVVRIGYHIRIITLLSQIDFLCFARKKATSFAIQFLKDRVGLDVDFLAWFFVID
jgi:hypothetical protein